jgi:hypothetical protein
LRRGAVAVTVATLLAASPAWARSVDVTSVLGTRLDRVARETALPVLVPRRIELSYGGRVYGSGSGTRRSWALSLASSRRCGANACFLAAFTGHSGERPSNPVRVRLAQGRTGYYRARSCGGSCAPPSIEFTRRGGLSSIPANVPGDGARARRALVSGANSALRAGPR